MTKNQKDSSQSQRLTNFSNTQNMFMEFESKFIKIDKSLNDWVIVEGDYSKIFSKIEATLYK